MEVSIENQISFSANKTIICKNMFYYSECEMVKINMAKELLRKKERERKKHSYMHIYGIFSSSR